MAKKWKQPWGRKLSYLFWGGAGLALIVVLLWMAAGHLDFDDPVVWLRAPLEKVGVKTDLTVAAGDQTSGLRAVKVIFSQGDKSKVVLDRTFPPGGGPGAVVDLPVTLEPKALGFKEGKATLTVEVWDRSWRHLFQGRAASLTREVAIDLVPLNLAYQSVSHLLRAGGTGVICYHLNKEVKESGLLTGGRFYQGFPNPKGKPGDYVVLFPVPQEGPTKFQAELVARPSVSQEVKQAVALQDKPRKWRRDQMKLSDEFLRRVAAKFPAADSNNLLGTYLDVNRNLRRANHATFQKVCSHSNPQPLWSGAFQRFSGKRMARFGDRRTYIYQSKAVDQETHQGVDLASVVHSPVYAANNGIVVFAAPLGIYGNTVILDHGLGVFSSYSHMSKIDVKVGDKVRKGAPLGHSGSTGLAAGDHLHFAINLQGEFVNPLEWCDAHWMKDQVVGVWAHAGAAAPAVKAATAPKGASKPHKGKKKPGKHIKAKLKRKR